MRRWLAVLAGLVLVVGAALPVTAADAREPREPRKPGETRSGSEGDDAGSEGDDGGPRARSGNASASNSANVVGGRGHVSQSTSVETGDVVVGGTVRGTDDGRGTTSNVQTGGEATPEPTPRPTPRGPQPTPTDDAVSGEPIDADPIAGEADGAGPDLGTWVMAALMLLGIGLVFRKLPESDSS